MPERERTQLIDALGEFAAAYGDDPMYADLLPGLEQLTELLVGLADGGRESMDDSPGRREAEQAAMEAAEAGAAREESPQPAPDIEDVEDESGPDNSMRGKRKR